MSRLVAPKFFKMMRINGSALALLALVLMSASLAAAKEDEKNHLLYDSFLDLSDEHANSDGIWWKARQAAQFTKAACDGEAPDGLGVKESKKMDKDGAKLMAASTDRYDLVLAFCVEEGTFESVAAESKGEDAKLAEVSFIDPLVNGTEYASDVLESFKQFTGKDGIAAIAADFHESDRRPVNVLCTGAGEAAALVPLCATYAAMTFPYAHILAESFDGQWPGSNGRFNWTYSQIVDQYYMWPNDVSDYGDGELSEMTLDEGLEEIEKSELNVFGEANDVADILREVLDYATTVLIISPNGTDLTYRTDAPIEGNLTTSTYEVVPIKGENYDPTQLNFTIEAYAEIEADPSNCPLVLCKTRFPGFMSGMIYAEYKPWDPEWIGPVPLDEIMEDEKYERVKGNHDADGAVLYKEDVDTLYYIWRGSESTMDWLVDANIIEKDWPVSNGPERIWEDPEVSMGFYQQFTAITNIDAKDDSVNLEKIAMDMTGGRTPKMIVCTGQSLGAALSTLCGGYMAWKYPNSTVMVVNEGSPKTGDEHWVKYFNQHVGRAWRFVNEADQVPLLAPFDFVQHVRTGIWIHDGKILLQERPPLKLDQTNWDDHSYYVYSILQDKIANVSAPEWVTEDL